MSRLHSNVFLIVGGRVTSKTTFVKKLLDGASLPKWLLIDTFRQTAYNNFREVTFNDVYEANLQGNCHLPSSNIEDNLHHLTERVVNTMLVFEDCLKYISSNPQPAIRKICLDSKQRNNDVFFIYHSLSQVPPRLSTWADYLILFKTQERLKNQKSRLGGIYTQIEPAFIEVNKHKSKFYNKAVQLY